MVVLNKSYSHTGIMIMADDSNTKARSRAAKRTAKRIVGEANMPPDSAVETSTAEAVSDDSLAKSPDDALESTQTETLGSPESPAMPETPEEPAMPKMESSEEGDGIPTEEIPPMDAPLPSEEPPMSEAAEMPATPQMEESSIYTPPEGDSHETLKKMYHEALAMGETELAGEIYDALQDHRYRENKFRAGEEAKAEAKDKQRQADEAERMRLVKGLVAQHPELDDGGDEEAIEAFLTLESMYAEKFGMGMVEAFNAAAEKLYPNMPEAQMPGQPAPAEPPAVEPRKAAKKQMARTLQASAKNAPEPEPDKLTPTQHLKALRNRRAA